MSFGKEKPNTLQLMEKFNKIVTDVDNLNTAMESAKHAMNKKLAIINTINDYTTSLEKNIAAAQNKSNNYRVIFGHNTDKIKGGNYEIYGQTVHAKYVQIPNQVFNILTETGHYSRATSKWRFTIVMMVVIHGLFLKPHINTSIRTSLSTNRIRPKMMYSIYTLKIG